MPSGHYNLYFRLFNAKSISCASGSNRCSPFFPAAARGIGPENPNPDHKQKGLNAGFAIIAFRTSRKRRHGDTVFHGGRAEHRSVVHRLSLALSLPPLLSLEPVNVLSLEAGWYYSTQLRGPAFSNIHCYRLKTERKHILDFLLGSLCFGSRDLRPLWGGGGV